VAEFPDFGICYGVIRMEMIEIRREGLPGERIKENFQEKRRANRLINQSASFFAGIRINITFNKVLIFNASIYSFPSRL
jgi:hypothetical protein